jgi:hypothetical protein
VWRENIFKLTIVNESLHQETNDIGVRIMNIATSTNLVVESTIFPRQNFHKTPGLFLMGRFTSRLVTS